MTSQHSTNDTAPSVLRKYLQQLGDDVSTIKVRGRVREVIGLIVRATIPNVSIGDIVRIDTTKNAMILSEVVGFKDDSVLLMPFGDVYGIGPHCNVEATGQQFCIPCSKALLGRVLDGLGNPIDHGPSLIESEHTLWPVMRSAPSPLNRKPIGEMMTTGVGAIDGLLTLGKGQRIGLFAGSGVGKSTLMGQIARGSIVDIIVICLIGERGREVLDFLDNVLGDNDRQRAVVVCATSDMPSLVRLKSAFVATAIAEWFRSQGNDVLLMMDSVTRFARAQREVGLAAGEPPARQGYPPSVFSMLPQLLERAGNDMNGSITALYTVLVAGSDMEEPIADEVRGILDGHIILSRQLANRNHWPAIDILPSLSRVMNAITTKKHRELAFRFRQLLATYESKREIIRLGAYNYGSDEQVDLAMDLIDEMECFLKQPAQLSIPFSETIETLSELLA